MSNDSEAIRYRVDVHRLGNAPSKESSRQLPRGGIDSKTTFAPNATLFPSSNPPSSNLPSSWSFHGYVFGGRKRRYEALLWSLKEINGKSGADYPKEEDEASREQKLRANEDFVDIARKMIEEELWMILDRVPIAAVSKNNAQLAGVAARQIFVRVEGHTEIIEWYPQTSHGPSDSSA
ncbi:hypothetical protein BDZ45DRAFT_688894 [Acephala macrosclerotiorum]|nr:hypothetical protein BDZ45DRAFT_688894 [Acephala macrosclerotiorum]